MSGAEFLDKRGIDPEVWEARGCRRYEQGADWVKDEFRGFLPPTRLATVTKIVNQSSGWVMPKHPPPGFPPIAPQIRPDDAVVTDGRDVWHYHGPMWSQRPVYPPEAGEKLAGKPLPKGMVLYGAAAEAHVFNSKPDDDPYDPVTGLGRHKGVLIDTVHRHAARSAKYILLGKNQSTPARIDLHPLALERLPDADVVYFVLEGTPKNDSVLSAGGCVFSVPSVTLWDKRELTRFARAYLWGKTVLIVPDADWHTNPQVEWQALKIRTVLRELAIDAYVAAPPTEQDADPGHYHKGVDDFLGAGHTLGELWLDNREPPTWAIHRAVQLLHHQARDGARRALVHLSLMANEHGIIRFGFATLKNRLGMRDHGNRVVPTLQSIAHTFTIEHGSLETVQQPIPGRKGRSQTVWQATPTIKLDEEYRAERKRSRLLAEDFWPRTAIELLRAKVDDLEHWRHNVEARKEAA